MAICWSTFEELLAEAPTLPSPPAEEGTGCDKAWLLEGT